MLHATELHRSPALSILAEAESRRTSAWQMLCDRSDTPSACSTKKSALNLQRTPSHFEGLHGKYLSSDASDA